MRDACEGVAESTNTWYVPQPPASAATFRRLLRQSGAHVVVESDDNLMAGCDYLALHAASAGPKTFSLPQPARWTDLRTRDEVAREATEITVQASLGQTLLYAVG